MLNLDDEVKANLHVELGSIFPFVEAGDMVTQFLVFWQALG